jgi:hypothetical protein
VYLRSWTHSIVWLAFTPFGVQTASAISILVLAAACFPQAQVKVQEELDLVVGKDRGQLSSSSDV